jgi:hypothetical protein
MKFTLILFTALITGCSTTVPVTVKFPDVPGNLLVKCPQLNKLNDDAKLSDVSKTIVSNYTEYYNCAVKNDAWIEWYQVQKHIFEGLK